jgi:hypothetical protein
VLVPDPHEQKPSLGTVYGDLPDDLVKTLTKQLLSDRTYALISGLPVLQCLLQTLLQLEYVVSGCLGVGDVLHKVFAFLGLPVSRSYHII